MVATLLACGRVRLEFVGRPDLSEVAAQLAGSIARRGDEEIDKNIILGRPAQALVDRRQIDDPCHPSPLRYAHDFDVVAVRQVVREVLAFARLKYDPDKRIDAIGELDAEGRGLTSGAVSLSVIIVAEAAFTMLEASFRRTTELPPFGGTAVPLGASIS